jgi:hypothetical protein
MAQTLTSAPRVQEPMVITYTKQCTYRPHGRALELLLALRASDRAMTGAELGSVAHMLISDVAHTLKPALRFGIVRAAGDCWEWVR